MTKTGYTSVCPQVGCVEAFASVAAGFILLRSYNNSLIV